MEKWLYSITSNWSIDWYKSIFLTRYEDIISSVAEMLHLVGTIRLLFFLPSIPKLNTLLIWLISTPLLKRSITASFALILLSENMLSIFLFVLVFEDNLKDLISAWGPKGVNSLFKSLFCESNDWWNDGILWKFSSLSAGFEDIVNSCNDRINLFSKSSIFIEFNPLTKESR